MRTLVIAAAVLACALGLTACTDGDGTSPSPTAITESASLTPAPSLTPTPSPTPSPSPTATPSPTPSPSPTAADVPDDLSTIADDGEVTLAEAQAVIDVQNQIYNDALLRFLTTRLDTGSLGTDFPDAMASIHTDDLLNRAVQSWETAARNGFEGSNTTDPTPVTERVTRVLETEPGCVVLELERDTNGLSLEDIDSSTWIMSIVDRRSGSATNSTGWYREILTLRDNYEPEEDPCNR